MNATNLVYLKDAKGMTDSLTIAKEFGKKHKDVLRKIEGCVERLPSTFAGRNFTPGYYTDENSQERPRYEMTRDAFFFLVLGFTGKRADAVKLLFIEEFNRMESKLIDVGLQAAPLTTEDLLRMTSERLAETTKELVNVKGLQSQKERALYNKSDLDAVNKELLEQTK